MNVNSSNTPLKGEILTNIRPKLNWTDINWVKVEEHANRLQIRITMAVKTEINSCPGTERVTRCLTAKQRRRQRYEGKLSCTVLRRGEAGNRLVLSRRLKML